ncbi:MAG: DNA polymerase III subunit gamma/tau [Magnetococcus sp. DMHC-8]
MSSYVVLARRWRPRTFQALVGQGHVTRALTHALTTGRVPHAFLFSGIRGVGKTTLARLLAMCLDCEQGVSAEPCGQCTSCREVIAGNHPDVLEIDAASRTKVEQMREVLDMVGYSPAVSRFKVYILDEVHMLSSQSFNALLKTLEEPPVHVKFIFATTEPRKIPATILSRCQRYDLKRVSRDLLTTHLQAVLTQESIPFEQAGIEAVVRSAEGSVRDALSLLDQVIAHGAGAVRYEAVSDLLGLTDPESILHLLDGLLHGRGPEVLQAAGGFYNNGVEPDSLVRELLDATHRAAQIKLLGTSLPLDGPTAGLLGTVVADVSLEHLQMVYQVLLRGSQDLRIAEDALQALEMLLLRVAYLKPVPSLEKLLSSLPGRNLPAAGGPVARQMLPVQQETVGAAGVAPVVVREWPVTTVQASVAPRAPVAVHADPVETAVLPPVVHDVPVVVRDVPAVPVPAAPAVPVGRQPGTSRSVPTMAVRPLTSWEQLVSFVASEESGLALKLERLVVCPVFEADAIGLPRRIHLRLTSDVYGTPDLFKQLLGAFLADHGLSGVEITVEPVSNTPREDTLEERAVRLRHDHQTQLTERIHSHPLMQQLLARFQAELVRVEPIAGTVAG